MKDCWAEVQADVIGCNRCATDLRDVDVDCPPGLLYPQGIQPPASIRVLFVGVAPPENGRHFYTDQSDNLRRGLFDTLADARDPAFPNPKTFSRLGGKRQVVTQLADFCKAKPGYEPVVDLCEPVLGAAATRASDNQQPNAVVGFVYLLKSGRYYKVGRSNSVGRREYEVGLQLPEPARLIHRIPTDDPVGIEAYWHRRFAAKRKNGEWFELGAADVSAFKRRKFM